MSSSPRPSWKLLSSLVMLSFLMASAWGLNMAFAEWVIRRRQPST